MKIDNKQGDHFFFNSGKQGKIFLAFLIIFFVFFGIISDAFKREIHEELIWIYMTFPKVFHYNTQLIDVSQDWIFVGIIPMLILFFTCFFLTYTEDIYLYGIKHSLWLVPFILGSSVFWYYYLYYWRPSLPPAPPLVAWVPINPFLLLFGTWQGWLNILILFSINLFGALAGWQVKELIRVYIKKEEALFIKRFDNEEEKEIEGIAYHESD